MHFSGKRLLGSVFKGPRALKELKRFIIMVAVLILVYVIVMMTFEDKKMY